MAKVVIEFDTVSKEMSVAIEGAAVDNVRGVSIYPSYDDDDEYRCCITTQSEDEENDMKSFTQLVASQTPEAKVSAAVPSNHEGFLAVAGTDLKRQKLATDVAGYFASARKGRKA